MSEINIGLWVDSVTNGKMGRPLPPPHPATHTWHTDRNVLYMRSGPANMDYVPVAAVVQRPSEGWIVLVKTRTGPAGWQWPIACMEVPLIPEAGVWLLPDDFHDREVIALKTQIEAFYADCLKLRKKRDDFIPLNQFEEQRAEKLVNARRHYVSAFRIEHVEPLEVGDVMRRVKALHRRYREKWNSPEEVTKRNRAEAKKNLRSIIGAGRKK
jgi:hypothetical protein